MCAVKDVEVVARYAVEKFGSLKPGDAVKVDMPVRGGLRAAFIMYVLPLVGLGAGMTAGYFAGLPEWGSLLVGLAAMALIYVVVAMNNKRFEANPDYMGEVVALLQSAEEFEEFGSTTGRNASDPVQIEMRRESQDAER